MNWIDVKERLPEIGTDKNFPDASNLVLIYDGESVFTGFYEHGDWCDVNGNLCENEVTNWMPLPEPPKN